MQVPDSLISSAEGAEDGAAKYRRLTPIVTLAGPLFVISGSETHIKHR